MNSSPRLHDVSDVCGIVVSFVGAGKEAFALALVCHAWNDHVRYGEAFRHAASKRIPLTYTATLERGGLAPEDVDWRALLAMVSRERCQPMFREQRGVNDENGVEDKAEDNADKGGAERSRGTTLVLNWAASALQLPWHAAAAGWRWLRPPKRKIYMTGLDNAGKTTLIYRLYNDVYPSQTRSPRPPLDVRRGVTMGDNVFQAHDGYPHSSYWVLEQLTQLADAVVFVIDSCDELRLPEAQAWLQRVADNLRDSVHTKLLILANKQDRPEAMQPCEIRDYLLLDRLRANWCLQGCSGLRCNRLVDAFNWIATD